MAGQEAVVESNRIRPTVTIWPDDTLNATTTGRCETSYVTATMAA
jgi:hypothetical protein